MIDPTKAVVLEKRRAAAFVTLNRPDVLNALDPGMAAALHTTLVDVSVDEDVRCVVLRGAGKGFMAGGDVDFFRRSLHRLSSGDPQVLTAIFDDVHGSIRTLRRTPKPVVASVHGAVAGFGLSLLAACDLAIAAEDSVFTLAYCRIGASPDGGATFALPRTVGVKRSMELALLGDRFDAHRALSLGLVNWVVPAAQLPKKTEELAMRLTQGPAVAYAQTKALINASFDNDLDQQLDRERAAFLECAESDDFAEGVTAFSEKRPPRFRGR